MKNLRILFVMGFLKGVYFYVPIFTFFLLAHEVSLSVIVVAQVFYSLFTFFGEVPTGIFADRFGQRTSIILGYCVEASGIALILFFPTAAGLYAAYCLRGLGGSFLSGSEEALLYESVKRAPGQSFQRAYAKFLSNEHLGFICSTALAGFAYQAWGAQIFVPSIMLTVLCIAGAGVCALLLKGYKAPALDASVGAGMFTALRQSFSFIRSNNLVFALTVVGTLTISGEYFLQAVYQPHFAANAVSALWVGVALSFGSILNMLALRYVYVLERYFAFEKLLFGLNLTLGASYILMAVFLHPVFLVGVYILMNGLFNLQIPIVSDYINVRTSSAIRTTVLSGISFVRRFFQVFLTWMLGLAVGVWGIETSLMLQGAYLVIGILIGYYLLVQTKIPPFRRDS